MTSEIIQQVVLGFLFLLLSGVTFTAPGYLIVKKAGLGGLSFLDNYVLSTTIGFTAFTFVAYLLAVSHMRLGMWLFPLAGLIGLSQIPFRTLTKTKIRMTLFAILFLITLVLGIIGQVAINAPSGLHYADGIYFWSSHGHDGVWHLALIEEFKKGVYPFQNPEYAGHRLQNYHFFVDLFMSEIVRSFGFNKLDVYFRLVPLFFSLLMGLSSFVFVRLWTGNKWSGLAAAFFTLFAGSFGYILTLL